MKNYGEQRRAAVLMVEIRSWPAAWSAEKVGGESEEEYEEAGIFGSNNSNERE